MNAPTVDDCVYAALAGRKLAGAGPITRREVEAGLGIPRRDFERAVEALRNAHKPICSGPRGYYLADSSEDIAGCVAYLRTIAMSHLRTLRSMRRLLGAVTADEGADRMEAATR